MCTSTRSPARGAMQVLHDAIKRKFTARLSLGVEAGELLYACAVGASGRTIMDLEHTVVKPVARGKGVGAALADAACAHARDQGWDVKATCSYISDKYFTTARPTGFTYDPSTKLATLLA